MSEALPYRDAPIRVGAHHFAAGFSRLGAQVGWVAAPLHLLGAVRGALGVHSQAAAWRNLREPVVETQGVTEWRPVTALPFRDVPGARSTQVLHQQLRFALPRGRATLDRLGFRAPEVLWLAQSPVSPELSRSARPRIRIMRLSDRFESFGYPAVLNQALLELSRSADVLIASARTIIEQLDPTERARAVFVPNGVDLSHFEGASDSSRLSGIPRPRAVYVGTIDWWFDVDWLRALARRSPETSFVLVGPEHVDIRAAFSSEKNVHILGRIPYSEVPSILHSSDVGLIPFRRSPLTDAVNPIKLYEYAACGLSTVATELRELRHLVNEDQAPAALSDDPEIAARSLSRFLGEGRSTAAREFAARHDWSESLAKVWARIT